MTDEKVQHKCKPCNDCFFVNIIQYPYLTITSKLILEPAPVQDAFISATSVAAL